MITKFYIFSMLHLNLFRIATPLSGGKRIVIDYLYCQNLQKKYICIPATSVPSKHVFSLAGYIVYQRMACLLPENVNTVLVFLAEKLM